MAASLFISLVLVSTVMVPLLAKRYVSRMASRSGVEVEMGEVGYDPFFGLRVKGLAISSKSNPKKAFIKVKHLELKHDLLSTVLGRGISLECVITGGEIDLSGGGMKAAADLVKRMRGGATVGGKWKKRGGGVKAKRAKALGVNLKALRGWDFSVTLPSGERVYFDELTIDRNDFSGGQQRGGRQKRGRRIGQGAFYFVSASRFRDTEFLVDASFVPGTKRASIELYVPALKPSTFVRVPVRASVFEVELKGEFEMSGGLKGTGAVTVVPVARGYPLGSLNYEINYLAREDRALIESVELSLDGKTVLKARGAIDRISSPDRSFDIVGEGGRINVERVANLFPSVLTFRPYGVADIKSIALKGTPSAGGGLTLGMDVALEDAGFGSPERGVSIGGLDAALKVKKVLGGDVVEGEGFTASGDFSVKRVTTLYGGAEAIKGKALYEAAGSEGRRLVVKGVRFRALGGSGSGEATVVIDSLGGKLRGSVRGEGFHLSGLDLGGLGAAGDGVSVAGVVEDFDARLSSADLSRGYGCSATFSISNPAAVRGGEVLFKARRLEANSPLTIGITRGARMGGGRRGGLTIEGRGIQYSGLRVAGVAAFESGGMDTAFSYGTSSGLDIKVLTEGKGFRAQGVVEGALGFRAELVRDGASGVLSGSVVLKDAKALGRIVDRFSSDFKFTGDRVSLSGLSLDSPKFGSIRAPSLAIDLAKGKMVKLTIHDADINGAYGGISLAGISTSLLIRGLRKGRVGGVGVGRLRWSGGVKVKSGKGPGFYFENARFGITGSDGSLQIEGIKASVNDGKLAGELSINNSEPRSRVKADFAYSDGVISHNNSYFSLKRATLVVDAAYVRHPESPWHSLFGLLGRVEFDAEGITPETFEGDSETYHASLDVRGTDETFSAAVRFKRDVTSEEIALVAKGDKSGGTLTSFEAHVPEFDIDSFAPVILPLLSGYMDEPKLSGVLSADIREKRMEDASPNGNAVSAPLSLDGGINITGLSITGMINNSKLDIEGVNGVIYFRPANGRPDILASLVTGTFRGDKRAFKHFVKSLARPEDRESRSLEIERIAYGPLEVRDVECDITIDQQGFNLDSLWSGEVYGGEFLAEGAYPLPWRGGVFNLAFLMRDVSLALFTKGVGMRDYITGRVHGLVSITGKAGDIDSVDGSFSLWSVKSRKEKRRIGRALLKKLGMKGKLLLRSSRGYNRGVLYGKIVDGNITFKKLNVSHSILGFKDLAIRVNHKKNSISISQLFYVMRETAKRVEEGQLEFEYK